MQETNPQGFSDKDSQSEEEMCQTGKSYEEILPYLLSGEADDLSLEFTSKI
ncbi:MAG TPA: hypothetical protein VHO71_04190 [Caproiciproducens sp.]|nr:hypothetical protein [Caproiciproducens sp.]